MEMVLNGKNLYVVDKVPGKLEKLEVLADKVLLQGVCSVVRNEVYSCLYSEELKNIIFIVRGEKPHTVTMILNAETFEKVLKYLKTNCAELSFSEQDKKINGYATALVDKLKAGIELTIVDSTDTVKVPICPECGMQCDPSIPYCMECGASI